MPLPILAIDALTIRYGEITAVERLALSVARGEILGLLGPNGSGKSSTLGAIAGDVRVAEGSIRVAGVREPDSPLEYRRRLGLVPQEIAVYGELTAEENLRFFGKLYGLRGASLRQRVADTLALVCLNDLARRPVHTFSGGMQRRLNLACALLHQPDLLLLDEPTVGLDIQSRDAIFASLRHLRDEGMAIVFTTHHLEEAELLCDRIGIIDQGRLIALGTLDELTCRSEAAPRARRLRPPALIRADGPQALPAPLRRSRVPRLETLYLDLTGRGLREE